MKYLSNYRKFCLEYGPYIKEWANKEQTGIFGEDNYEETIAKLHETI